MERLTKRFEGIEEASLSCERCGKNAIYECWSQENCTQTAVDRLASIEDILGDTYDLDRLRELVEADKDGRCVILWAAPGTKVFEIEKTCSCGGHEEKFKYFPRASECVSCWEECDASSAINVRTLFSFELKTPPNGLGKTVFLTREDAEAALAKEVEK